jgi:hypothetical protein
VQAHLPWAPAPEALHAAAARLADAAQGVELLSSPAQLRRGLEGALEEAAVALAVADDDARAAVDATLGPYLERAARARDATLPPVPAAAAAAAAGEAVCVRPGAGGAEGVRCQTCTPDGARLVM